MCVRQRGKKFTGELLSWMDVDKRVTYMYPKGCRVLPMMTIIENSALIITFKLV